MKWFFILLLVINIIYLGWEMDRDAKFSRTSVSSAIKVPAGTQELILLSEMEKLPDTRSRIKLDHELSMANFNSEPVLPVQLNPNTEKMIKSLLPETSNSTSDNESELMEETEDFSLQGLSADTSISALDKTVCYRYGPIPNQGESELLSKWLNDRDITFKQRQTDEQGKQLFWVYLAPQESRAQAEAAMKDLKEKGIKDMRLIQEGDLLNAISLGLFSSQASVNRRLNEIKAKGYQSVVVPYSGGKKIHWFDVSIVQNSNYVNDLFTGFPSRFNALPIDCNAIAMR